MSYLILNETITPTPPAPSKVTAYAKSDGNLYYMSSDGVEHLLAASNAITVLTGDVTGTGPGSTAATVVSVGGKTSSNISQSVTDTQSATSSNTNSTIVKRDSSGNFSAGTITATLAGNASTATSATTAGNVSGIVTVTHGGTNATTAPVARVNLNIDERSTFSNANYTVLSTDRYVAQVGTLSAPRTVTLPLANSVNAGQQLTITDESGTVTTTNTLTITASGSDTINTSASKTIRTGFGYIILYSNGSNEWFTGVEAIGRGGTGLSTLPTDGQLLIGQSSSSSYLLANLTAGTGITVTNAGGSITITGNSTFTQVTKTSNYTILNTDSIIFCDTSGGAFTLTLPNPSTLAGKMYRVIDTKGTFGTNNLTLARSSTEKIEGLTANKVLQTNWGWFNITTNSTDWFIS